MPLKKVFLLDNDGVLSNAIHYDDFWYRLVPRELAKRRKVSFKEASKFCINMYDKTEGTLNWADVTFWNKLFGFDIRPYLKSPKPFPDALKFLKKHGKRSIVVTAAHPDFFSVTIKYIKKYVKKVYSTFDFGLTKEDVGFFKALMLKEKLSPENCIFVDDMLKNVLAARKAGITAYVIDRKSKKKKTGIVHSLSELI